MGSKPQASFLTALSELTANIGQAKQAAANGGHQKAAGDPIPADPGGYSGSSSHPTAHVDNHGQNVQEGARSAENERDVKEDQGAPSVNNASDMKPGIQDDVQLNIGTKQTATGEDPAVEDDYKGGKDDPGSTHPARTDNNALDGEKYASATISQCRDFHGELANSILADLAMGRGSQLGKQAAAQAAPAKPAQPASELDTAIKQAAAKAKAGAAGADHPATGNADLQAGYDLAAAIGIEKQAAQSAVAGMIETAINEAQEDADRYGAFFTGVLKKAAEAGASAEGEDHSSDGDDTSGANDAEGTSGGSGGGPGGEHVSAAGDPPGGGHPDGSAGGPPGGGVPDEAALMQLVSALDEAGIPIETLIQALSGGGGAPGGPPGAGGPPPADPMGGGMGGPPADPMGGGMGGPPPADPAGSGAPPMGDGMKLASAVNRLRRSGKYQFKVAYAGTPERIMRDQMKSHVGEILGRKI